MARISALKIVFHCKHKILTPTSGKMPTNIKKDDKLVLNDPAEVGPRIYIVESLLLKHTDSAYIEVRVKPRL